jgi:hypothetical protein
MYRTDTVDLELECTHLRRFATTNPLLGKAESGARSVHAALARSNVIDSSPVVTVSGPAIRISA